MKSIHKKIEQFNRLYKELSDHGIKGDTELVHVNEFEVQVLKALGGSGTKNTVTGLRQFFGGGGGKQTSQTIQTKTDVPEWFKPYLTEVFEKAQALSATTTTDPDTGEEVSTYQPPPGAEELTEKGQDRLAAVDPSMEAALASLGSTETAQTGLSDMAAAQALTAGSTQEWAGLTGDQRQSMMNPFQQAVTDISTREAVRRSEPQRQAIAARAAKAGAFGGSRAGMMTSEFDKNLNQSLSDIQSQGDMAAYNQALSQFNMERGRQAAAGAQLGAQAAQEQAMTFGGLGQQLGAGQARRGLGQQYIDTGYQQFLEERSYPKEQLGYMSGIIRGYAPQYDKYAQTSVPYNPYQAGLGMVGAAGAMGKGFGLFQEGGIVNSLSKPVKLAFGGTPNQQYTEEVGQPGGIVGMLANPVRMANQGAVPAASLTDNYGMRMLRESELQGGLGVGVSPESVHGPKRHDGKVIDYSSLGPLKTVLTNPKMSLGERAAILRRNKGLQNRREEEYQRKGWSRRDATAQAYEDAFGGRPGAQAVIDRLKGGSGIGVTPKSFPRNEVGLNNDNFVPTVRAREGGPRRARGLGPPVNPTQAENAAMLPALQKAREEMSARMIKERLANATQELIRQGYSAEDAARIAASENRSGTRNLGPNSITVGRAVAADRATAVDPKHEHIFRGWGDPPTNTDTVTEESTTVVEDGQGSGIPFWMPEGEEEVVTEKEEITVKDKPKSPDDTDWMGLAGAMLAMSEGTPGSRAEAGKLMAAMQKKPDAAVKRATAKYYEDRPVTDRMALINKANIAIGNNKVEWAKLARNVKKDNREQSLKILQETPDLAKLVGIQPYMKKLADEDLTTAERTKIESEMMIRLTEQVKLIGGHLGARAAGGGTIPKEFANLGVTNIKIN